MATWLFANQMFVVREGEIGRSSGKEGEIQVDTYKYVVL